MTAVIDGWKPAALALKLALASVPTGVDGRTGGCRRTGSRVSTDGHMGVGQWTRRGTKNGILKAEDGEGFVRKILCLLENTRVMALGRNFLANVWGWEEGILCGRLQMTL